MVADLTSFGGTALKYSCRQSLGIIQIICVVVDRVLLSLEEAYLDPVRGSLIMPHAI